VSGGFTLAQGRLAVVLRGLTLVASLVALLYVAGVLATNWDTARARGSRLFTLGLAIAFPAATSALLLLAGTWHWVLRQLGIEVSRLDAMHAWFTGNLHKYIPGQVWLAVGRTAKGAQVGVPARATLGTTAIEQGFSVLAAGLALGVAQGWPALAVPAALATAGLLQPRVANAGLALVGRIGRRPLPLVPLRRSQLAVLYLVSLAALGLGLLAMAGIMLGLGIFRLPGLRAYVVALTGSFLSGYLFFGAPAGLGVREGALLVLLGRAGISAGDASMVAVATRIVTVVAELVCFLVVSALARTRSPRPPAEP
jgi:uncharacterized membrane protein YbhN (UPF0104 family)